MCLILFLNIIFLDSSINPCWALVHFFLLLSRVSFYGYNTMFAKLNFIFYMVSHCWRKELQMWNGKRVEWSLWCFTGIRAIGMNSWFLMGIDRYRNSYRHTTILVYIHTCIPWLCLLIECGSSAIPTVTSTPTTYTLVSKHHEKELSLLWEMADFRIEAERVQGQSGMSSTKQEGHFQKMMWLSQKDR